MTVATTLLSIGEVAGSTGVAVSALRYYAELGLIEVSARVGGQRRFDPGTVGRVNFVRRAQEVGFSLEEIRAILDDNPDASRALVSAKLSEMKERRSRLDTIINTLKEIQDCGCVAVESCQPIVAGSAPSELSCGDPSAT